MLKWAILFLGLTASSTQAVVIEKTTVQTSAKIPVVLVMPDKIEGKIPAMVLLHGSGGMNLKHKMIYADEFAKMGIATAIVDTFSPRGIKNTVTDQNSLTARDMAKDVIQVMHGLAHNPKIDGTKIGLMGFSKGGTATMIAATPFLNDPREAGFALFIAMYPSCNNFALHPRTTGKPIKLLIAGSDKYVNPEYCLEVVGALRANSANVSTAVLPTAQHGWDVPGPLHWSSPRGENYSQCKFVEVTPRIWVESHSNIRVADANGPTKDRKKALAKCVTHGISGGYSVEAAAKSMGLVKTYLVELLK
jgi:dienelactone hydrolase